MIRAISLQQDISGVGDIIRRSFATVAEQFGLTPENCPRHTAFLSDEHLKEEMVQGLQAFTVIEDDCPIGVIGIGRRDERLHYLQHLAVLPEHRHRGWGARMVKFACSFASNQGAEQLGIAIIDENTVLKNWYDGLGFVEIERKQFPHLPFTVCFMNKNIEPLVLEHAGDYSIRPATQADAEDIIAVVTASSRVTMACDYAAEAIDAYLAEKTPERYASVIAHGGVFVAVQEERIVGFSVGAPGRITNLYVLPECQRQGIGAALFGHAEAVARHGADTILIYSSLTAQHFYARHGYTAICEGSFMIGEVPFPYIEMRKEIGGQNGKYIEKTLARIIHDLMEPGFRRASATAARG